MRAPEGTSLEETRHHRRAHRARDPRRPATCALTVTTIGEDNAQTRNLATIYVRADRPDEAQGDAEPAHGLGARARSSPSSRPSLRITVSEVSRVRRRRLLDAAQPVQRARARPRRSSSRSPTRRSSKLKNVPGAVDVDSSLIVGKPEIGVYIDRARAADLGVQPSDIANALRLLVEGDQVSNYEEHGEQYEVHVRARAAVPRRRGGAAPADGAVVAPRVRAAGRRRAAAARHGPLAHRPPEPRAPGARSWRTRRPGYSDGAISAAMKKILDDEHLPAGYTAAPYGPDARDGARVRRVRARRSSSRSSSCTWCSRRSSSRGCTRSRSCSRLPLTLPFALHQRHPLQAGDRHLLDPRHPGALRRREEERDPPDRPHQPAARRGHAAARGHPAGEPRPAAAHPDDDGRVRGRHDPARAVARASAPGSTARRRAWSSADRSCRCSLTLLATPVAYSLFDDALAAPRRLFGVAPAPEPIATPMPSSSPSPEAGE